MFTQDGRTRTRRGRWVVAGVVGAALVLGGASVAYACDRGSGGGERGGDRARFHEVLARWTTSTTTTLVRTPVVDPGANVRESQENENPGGEQQAKTVSAFVTAYTFADNDPPGSATISDPVLHQTAGGAGTFSDPITLAVAAGAYEPGTKLYIPHVQRYFIVEDTCASCGDVPDDAEVWIDMWIGGTADDDLSDQERCASAVTTTLDVHVDPEDDLTVVEGPIFDGGECSTPIAV